MSRRDDRKEARAQAVALREIRPAMVRAFHQLSNEETFQEPEVRLMWHSKQPAANPPLWQQFLAGQEGVYAVADVVVHNRPYKAVMRLQYQRGTSLSGALMGMATAMSSIGIEIVLVDENPPAGKPARYELTELSDVYHLPRG